MVTAGRVTRARLPRPPRERDFPSALHGDALTARVGLLLAVCFSTCFATGLLSHLIQHPPTWFLWPTRPVSLYRVTQGVHVLTGTAAVPLILVKLWLVYPRLFVSPPVRSVLHALERASVAVLVGACLFELVSGLQNIAHWYPWGFSFPPAHFAMAWVATGSILLHVAVKLPAIRLGLATSLDGPTASGKPAAPVVTSAPIVGVEADVRPMSRRWILGAAAAGVATVLLATAGSTVPWLRRVSVLAVRDGSGPQDVPVNKSAVAAGITAASTGALWRLEVSGPGGVRRLALEDLQAMPQRAARLPIACVEGWSAEADWEGVRVRDILALVGAPATADVGFRSLQRTGSYGTSTLPARHAQDDLSLLALRLNGEPLHPDHGYPCRLITPSRPGVTQTKWLSHVEVLP